MADWEQFLDKFLVDVDLPVLENAGSVSKDAALDFAHSQCDQFSEQRRAEAQQRADTHYLDDLKKTAKALERRKGSRNDEP
jgi:hypothetical protein